MVLSPTWYRLAQSREEIEPLIQLCKEGNLFQVQEWIEENNLVDPPVPENGRSLKHTPLRYAIERGFHSLVEVLLEGGASYLNRLTAFPKQTQNQQIQDENDQQANRHDRQYQCARH